MAHFYIHERADRDLTILDLAGWLRPDRANILLGNTLRHLVRRGQNRIILNFSKVSHIDGFGVRELIQGCDMISNAGGQLKICNVKSRSLELMPLTELSIVFEFFEREEDATDSFRIRRNYFSGRARVDKQVPDLETMEISKKNTRLFYGDNRA